MDKIRALLRMGNKILGMAEGGGGFLDKVKNC
jgi:hypothetical protein